MRSFFRITPASPRPAQQPSPLVLDEDLPSHGPTGRPGTANAVSGVREYVAKVRQYHEVRSVHQNDRG
jgi:hypothetical protein